MVMLILQLHSIWRAVMQNVGPNQSIGLFRIYPRVFHHLVFFGWDDICLFLSVLMLNDGDLPHPLSISVFEHFSAPLLIRYHTPFDF